jgi:hypothetical protein
LWGKLRKASPEYLTDGCDALSGNTAAVQLVELYYLLPEEEFEVKSLYFLCLSSFLLVASLTATGD